MKEVVGERHGPQGKGVTREHISQRSKSQPTVQRYGAPAPVRVQPLQIHQPENGRMAGNAGAADVGASGCACATVYSREPGRRQRVVDFRFSWQTGGRFQG